MAYFFKKMIFVETCYGTQNEKLLNIVKSLKTWHYYLENCKHEIFILTDYNNLCCFIDTKNLSFK